MYIIIQIKEKFKPEIMKIYVLIFIILIFFFCSCNNRNKEIENELSQILGKDVELIDTLSYFSINRGLYNDSIPHQMKIVSYIDGSCGSCLYALASWKELLKSKDFENVFFRLYVKTYNLNQLSLILEEIDFNYPVVVDFQNQFYEKNNIQNQINYETLLVNKDNKILLVGNPLLNDEIKNLYLEAISKYK